ncbi:hypothetical protein MTO96_048943 [Rhipicephalus appendiculatus]
MPGGIPGGGSRVHRVPALMTSSVYVGGGRVQLLQCTVSSVTCECRHKAARAADARLFVLGRMGDRLNVDDVIERLLAVAGPCRESSPSPRESKEKAACVRNTAGAFALVGDGWFPAEAMIQSDTKVSSEAHEELCILHTRKPHINTGHSRVCSTNTNSNCDALDTGTQEVGGVDRRLWNVAAHVKCGSGAARTCVALSQAGMWTWPSTRSTAYAGRAVRCFCRSPCCWSWRPPIKICGDTHGQYYDLLRLFEYGGFPPDSNYLFLGDYVDRGRHSLETVCLLLCYKIKYPENFFILRGNHESASINRVYGFYDECKRRYNIKMWKTFTDLFNCLPVAAIVDEKIFCMHGGLSPDLQTMEQVRRIMRPTDVPDAGLLCDLLWSDPDKDIMGWGESDRGVSFTFGADIVGTFLHKHDLDLICRAHQVVEDGYEFFAKRQLVTIFSAPNYCGTFDNAAAIMSVDESLMCSFQILKPAGKKKSAAIKTKLIELGAYVDDELPDYIMAMIANKKTKKQITQDLSLFLGDSTLNVTTWYLLKLSSLFSDCTRPVITVLSH